MSPRPVSPPARPGFRRRWYLHRVFGLLLVLLAVACWRWRVLAEARTPPDWAHAQEIVLYPVLLAGVDPGRVAPWLAETPGALEDWFSAQRLHWTGALGPAVRVRLTPTDFAGRHPPHLPDAGDSFFARWQGTRRFLDWFEAQEAGRPPAGPETTRLFVVIAPDGQADVLGERDGVGSRRGRLGIVAASDDPEDWGNAQAVMAHEILHALGATDRRADDLSLPWPEAYADPRRVPLHPQRQAVAMALGIPLSPRLEGRVEALDEVVVGLRTAVEIGWVTAERTGANP